MVNYAMVNRSKKRREQRQQEMSERKEVRFREVRFGEKGTFNFRLVSATYIEVCRHCFAGGKLLWFPRLCDVEIYGKSKCKDCNNPGPNSEYGNSPETVRLYLAHFFDFDGKKITLKNGKKKSVYPIMVLPVKPKPKGRVSQENATMFWDVFDDEEKNGTLLKRVFQVKIVNYNWKGEPKIVPPDKLEEYDGGRIPKKYREEIADLLKEVDEKNNHVDLIPHLLNINGNVIWEDWDVEEPEIEEGQGAYSDSDDAGFDEDDDESDEDEDDSDDDDDDRRTSRKKSRGASRFRAKKSDDDEDEDDEEEEERPVRKRKKVASEDEDEEDSKPTRRKSKRVESDEDEDEPTPGRRGKSKKSSSDDEDEEEEKPARRKKRSREDDEEEDDSEDEESEDEEEYRPRRKKRR